MRDETLATVGKSEQRIGAREKLVGLPLFAADIDVEDAVTLLALRSDRPHARILELDIADALRVPGCLAVFTQSDIPGKNRLGIIIKDQQLLAEDKVRCVGDPIALVAAEDLNAAEEALRAIRICYEDLPAIFDPEEALRPGAIEIHEGGNLLGRRVTKRGSPEAAFKEADVIVERTYTTPHIEHTYLEPDAGVAYLDSSGVLVIYASTQNPHYDRKDVADLLGLEEDRVRVIQAATGGGFGSKLDLNVQGFVGLAAYLLKRPARMVYTREEAYLCTTKRHPLKIHYKSAATRDGRLIAVDVRISADTGAYTSYGPAVLARAATHATGPYDVPNAYVEAVFAYTNNSISGAMRGFGVPQMAFAHESQMDLLAKELGMSPMEIRLRNCYRTGSVTSTGQELRASVGIRATLEAVEPYYQQTVQQERKIYPPHIRRGVGLASMGYGIGNTGMQNPSTAEIELDDQGQVTLFTGAADIGQGSSTVLLQIAAEELGLRPEDIRLVVADTGLTTSAGATSASRQTYISGNAVLEAAGKLRDVVLTESAMILKTDRNELVLEAGNVRSRSHPEKTVSFKEVARRAHRLNMPLKWQGYFNPETSTLDPETGQGIPYSTYAFATHTAEVEVDIYTGEVRVLRVVAAHDVGKAINPSNVRGQIYSGVAMGLGFALMEEYVPGKTESMKDYHIPSIADMPEVVPIIVEDPEPTGPYGAKGVGEPALIPTAPAVLNAIADALGTRIYDLPANLERVLKVGLTAKKS
ncbi:MAG TPA: xanthine dehydrogenase family protein molybdopterin-binding subunit [Desulfomonilaceae bacterium]|nr:xanthine dehydrogenase family protein molybdopterin-binding subunit [Desulfomonilaceae bacterium]